MTTQLPLITPKPPRVDKSDVEKLVSILTGTGWWTARMLRNIGNERFLRAVANASEGQIISGQKGYKLTIEATLEERSHATNWLRHQAKEMTKRATEIEMVSAMAKEV